MQKTENYITFVFVALVCLLITLLFLDLLIGTIPIPLQIVIDILSGKAAVQNELRLILLDYRLPKTITTLLTGAALAVSGLQMQTVFRNPLAGPYVLGISAGSGLGIVLVLIGFSAIGIVLTGTFNDWIFAISAWCGAAGILFLIFLISLRIKDIMTILIFGVLFSSISFAIINLMQYFGSAPALKSYLIWTMGSLSAVTWHQLHVFLPGVLSGLIIALISCKILNSLLLGENYAKSMGLNIHKARLLVFFSTSLMTGLVTAFCGPIGFIGIVVPHIARIVFKSANHFILVPGCVILGCIILLISDILSQLPSHFTLPINSVTALIGIPVIIWIIIRNRKFASVS